MIALTILLCAVLGAVGRRVCGGGFQDLTRIDVGDVPVRIFFGLCLGAAALLGGAVWWMVVTVAVGTFLSCSIPIHWRLGRLDFGGIAMGRNPKHSWWNDASGLLLHAVLGIGALGLIVVAAGGDGWWLLVAAFAVVPCYEAGWKFWATVWSGWDYGSAWGELFWGAACGVAAWGV